MHVSPPASRDTRRLAASAALVCVLLLPSTDTQAQMTVSAGIHAYSEPPVGATHHGEAKPTAVNQLHGVCLTCPLPVQFLVCHQDNCQGPGAAVPGAFTSNVSIASGWSGLMRLSGAMSTPCPGVQFVQGQWYPTTGQCSFFLAPTRLADCTDPGTCDASSLGYFARYGGLAGVVRFADGTPAANVPVTASPVDDVFSVAGAITDQNGAFNFARHDAAHLPDMTGGLVDFTLSPGVIPLPGDSWALPVLGDGGHFGPSGKRVYSNSIGKSSWNVSAGGSAVAFVTVESGRKTTVELILDRAPDEDPDDKGDEPDVRPPGEDEPVEPEDDESPDPEEPPEEEGCPVSLATGNVFLDQTDAVVPGLRRNLLLARSYNSRAAFHGRGGAFGRGWTHAYEKSVTVHPTGLLKLRKGNGVSTWFSNPDGGTTYGGLFPARERSRISRSAAGFARHFIQGGHENYGIDGRLTQIVDRVGHVTQLERDPQGRLLAIVDPSSRRLSFDYGFDGRVRQVSGPAGVLATYSYSPQGFLTAVSYPDGGGFTYSYDAHGQLLRITDATGRVVESHAYADGRGLTSEIGGGLNRHNFSYSEGQTVVVDGLGHATTYGVAPTGGVRRVHSVSGACCSCDGGSGQRSWTFTPEGRVASYRNGAGQVRSYAYNSNGDLASITDPTSRVTTFTYDAPGRTPAVTMPSGARTLLANGPAGPTRLTNALGASTPDPDDFTTRITYTDSGLAQSVIDPMGRATLFAHDSQGNLTRITNPLGAATPDPDDHVTTLAYDAMGRPTLARDALGHDTRLEWDTRGRVRRTVLPDGSSSTYAYDLAGRITSQTDPAGRTTRFAYDDAGRLERIVDPSGAVTRYEYDSMSRLVALVDANGHATRYEHTDCGLVSKTTWPDASFESYTYDGAGRLATRTDRRQIVSTFSYFDDGRLQSLTFSDGSPALSYTYDDDGRLLTATQATRTLTLTRDLAGQVTTEHNAPGPPVTFSYFDDGRLRDVRLDGTLAYSYEYDGAGRLQHIRRGPHTFTFAHDQAYRRASLEFPNGLSTSYSYDDLSRLTSLVTRLGSAERLRFDYELDAASNRTRKTGPGFDEAYAYDSVDRLTRVTRTGSHAGLWRFEYDPVGNRLVEQLDQDATRWQHDNANRLLNVTGGGPLLFRGQLDESAGVTLSSVSVNNVPATLLPGNAFEARLSTTPGPNTVTVRATDGSGNTRTNIYRVDNGGRTETWSYNPNGNTTQRTTTSGTWTYEWTALNQLARVARDGVEVARFEYDPVGRRLAKIDGTVTTTYTYAGADILRESRHEGGSTAARLYVHGPAIDEPLAFEDGSGLTCLHADGLGSLVATSAPDGTLTVTRDYDAFGNPLTGATTDGYAFTGREWDPETRLYYYRARYYDPSTGRFLSEDPIGFAGGVNFYAYVHNNPASLVDPLGLDAGSGMQNLDFGQPTWGDLADYLMDALSLIPGGGTATAVVVKGGSRLNRLYQITRDLRNYTEALHKLNELRRDLARATGPKARRLIEKEIDGLEAWLKGHKKKLRDKWGCIRE